MSHLSGAVLVPFALVAGNIEGREVRITEISTEGFVFRVAEKIYQPREITLSFFQFKEYMYREIRLDSFDRIEEQEKEFSYEYTIFCRNDFFVKLVQTLFHEYGKYISLKSDGDDAALSSTLTGYPTHEDDTFYSSFMEQKQIVGREAEALYQKGKAWSHNMQFELAFSLDRDILYRKYLELDPEPFRLYYWDQSGFSWHPFVKKIPKCIYVGNQFCHNLFPKKEMLYEIIKKALKQGQNITIVTTYLRDEHLDELKKSLEELYEWCKRNNTSVELVANDYGMLSLLDGKEDLIQPVLGILLNKRRKDPRMKYKKGIKNGQEFLKENNLNSIFYQNYLKEKYHILRYEYETCGYDFRIANGRHSLHLPYYQTNTSQYCTLYACKKHGDRGAQMLAENCERYCENNVFLYPKHLHMIGRYNSLFGLDITALTNEKLILNLLSQGIDRIVMEML